MRVAQGFLIAVLVVGLNGCVLRKPKTANTAPPVPAPAPVPTPAPPPEPVSVPQTNVHLPPPQPLTPEAIATTQPGETAPPPVAPTRTTTPQRTPRQRNTEPPPVVTPTPATPPPVENRAPFTEVLPASEQKRLQDEAAQRIQEARGLIAKIPRARRQRDTTVKRVEAFLEQSQDASRRGELRQASELAGRALVLAKELKP